MRKAAECVVGLVGAAAPNKGWRVFLLRALVVERSRMWVGQQGRCKKRDNPQPGRQRRRAQQGQRVDCNLLRE